ncbi:MAG: pantoate--beta-alanine ligase [Actinomycetota bacterium]|jgi:pantoate--beta-alanine ligase|nr:pantoate--beta-alanine ligase [Actinomycetota bacterium]
MSIERVSSAEETRRAVAEARREGRTVALVPTMGALHEGHLSLVRAACGRATYVVVSVFVNPKQFALGEDFEAYPRDLDRDMALLDAEGVDLVFAPTTDSMYSSDAVITVDPGPLAGVWEGASRPEHFRGVVTIVTKLLSIVAPDLAFFGEKDYQQLQIVKQLVRDLNLPVRVVGCPIVRDRDGLALSSRNAYLSSEDREKALSISKALEATAQAVAWGERSTDALCETMMGVLSEHPGVEVDYAALVDATTMADLERVDGAARAIIAARVGSTRLIDNVAIVPPGHEA